jgi:L-rhamnose mutarotase
MKRFGQVIGVKPETFDEYVKYHEDVWPDVLAMISECNLRNYSIYHKDNTLFAYFEYHGDDFEADMAKMAADPTTQKWWDIMMPMQAPVETRAEGEWWATMDEVFHTD